MVACAGVKLVLYADGVVAGGLFGLQALALVLAGQHPLLQLWQEWPGVALLAGQEDVFLCGEGLGCYLVARELGPEGRVGPRFRHHTGCTC